MAKIVRQSNKRTVFKLLMISSILVFSLNNLNIYGADSNGNHTSRPPAFVKDEILVKFKNGISKKDINKINKEYDAYIKGRKLIGGFKG